MEEMSLKQYSVRNVTLGTMKIVYHHLMTIKHGYVPCVLQFNNSTHMAKPPGAIVLPRPPWFHHSWFGI